MDLTSQADQTGDNQEFVQNLHLLQMKDKSVDNQIELNCSLILTKSLELLIINKNLQSIEAFDKCIENVDYLREFLSGSKISQKNTLLQDAYYGNQTLLVKFLIEICKISQLKSLLSKDFYGNDQKQFAFYVLEKMLKKSNLHLESDLVTFFCFGNEDQLLEALKTSTELIHIVAAGGRFSLIQNLIDKEGEANINATDIQGSTPPQLAAQNNKKQCAFFLLDKMLNKSNLHPESDLVTLFGFENQDQLLEALKTSTPLHLAIKSGHTNVVEFLISNNANN